MHDQPKTERLFFPSSIRIVSGYCRMAGLGAGLPLLGKKNITKTRDEALGSSIMLILR